jgi:Cu/Ag efflux protein CusF
MIPTMKTRKSVKLGFPVLVTLVLTLAGCASTQSLPPASTPSETAAPPDSSPVAGIAAETVITVHGKVIAIDSASKQVTLQGSSGKTVTLTVNNPYNLQSLRAGDRYLARFTESVSIIGKGPSDKPPVATLAAGLWSAKPGEIPGAAAAQAIQLVVVVSAIDQVNQRVTLQAPDGSTENIHVTNPAALQGVQVGDRIAISLTQSIVIALAPEAGSGQ